MTQTIVITVIAWTALSFLAGVIVGSFIHAGEDDEAEPHAIMGWLQ